MNTILTKYQNLRQIFLISIRLLYTAYQLDSTFWFDCTVKLHYGASERHDRRLTTANSRFDFRTSCRSSYVSSAKRDNDWPAGARAPRMRHDLPSAMSRTRSDNNFHWAAGGEVYFRRHVSRLIVGADLTPSGACRYWHMVDRRRLLGLLRQEKLYSSRTLLKDSSSRPKLNVCFWDQDQDCMHRSASPRPKVYVQHMHEETE